MSARTPRRSFANPFVLTLAALPVACTVQSGPAPQGPAPSHQHARNDEPRAHDHRNEPTHTNPPRPAPDPQPQPAQPEPQPMPPVANPPRPAQPPTTGNAPNLHDTANTNANTMQQGEPSPVDKGRGYRQWTITRTSGKCESHVKVHCPQGAMCNPPPPQKYACPKTLADGANLDIIQPTEKVECFVDFVCPPNAKCARPQKVTCPK